MSYPSSILIRIYIDKELIFCVFLDGYMIFGILMMVIGFIIFCYKRSIHKHPLKEETTYKPAQVAKRAEPVCIVFLSQMV